MERFDWMCLQLPLFFIFLCAYMIITVNGNNYIDDYIVWHHTHYIFSTTRLWCDHQYLASNKTLKHWSWASLSDFGVTIRHEYSTEVYRSRSKVNLSNCTSHHVHACTHSEIQQNHKRICIVDKEICLMPFIFPITLDRLESEKRRCMTFRYHL